MEEGRDEGERRGGETKGEEKVGRGTYKGVVLKSETKSVKEGAST